jgi:ABC-type glycerol-3-phosphate transport system substrate-binding protein
MKKSLILAFCTVAMLSACGGGGDDPAPAPAPTTEVPPSASMSVAGLMTYMKALIASAADTLEPVDVSVVTPPTDDAIEPMAVD